MLKSIQRVYIKVLLTLLGGLITITASGQKQDGLDSTLVYLNQLSGVKEKDSLLVDKMHEVMLSFKPKYLADPRLKEGLAKLKSKLKSDQYYAIAYQFLRVVNYTCQAGEYDYPIDYGLALTEELKPYTTPLQKFILLHAMRDIRVPFRNSSRIYEGIEHYSELSSYYLQRNDSAAVSIAYNVLASFYSTLGLADKAEYFQLKSIDYLDQKIYTNDNSFLGYGRAPNIGLPGIINRKTVLASYLISTGEYDKAISQLHESLALSTKDKEGKLKIENNFLYLQMARAKVLLQEDSVDYYFTLMRQTMSDTMTNTNDFAHYFQEKSYGFYMEGQLDSAEANIHQCLNVIKNGQLSMTSTMGALNPGYYLALISIKKNRFNEAIAALQPEIKKLLDLNLRKEALDDLKLLAEAFTLDSNYGNATKTYKEYSDLLNEMIKEERNNRSINFDIEKRMAENEKAFQLLQAENKYNQKKQYYLLGILALASLLAVGLLSRNSYRQKVNKELIRKNKEIETALNDLKSTQSQLIQSEKMASLGELTAGIAHEIQNPLNFVNNFAEVSHELIDEMKDGLDKGHIDEAKSIATDLQQNLEKITFHGKRADAIVKGMLQHSRSSSGVKEPTDINALADEYLRLAYHGLRARDKSFNATIKTDFDETIGKIDVIPQDIGRVLLNLITNAFHAVSAPLPPNTSAPLSTRGELNYVPTVTVTTKLSKPPIGGLGVQISISDNGPGIPDAIKDKIFQPFFTTKPTGQGTGLGLSLSYDIVKAHGGELKVETKVGEGSTFILTIPTH